MRTTLTLDEDVAANLKAESRKAGRPFRDVVNETLSADLRHVRPRTGVSLSRWRRATSGA